MPERGCLKPCPNAEDRWHIHTFQAGNDRVLRAMNRGYTAARYLELIDTAKKYMPDIVLTSDVIVGFPCETEDEFNDTLDILESAF